MYLSNAPFIVEALVYTHQPSFSIVCCALSVHILLWYKEENKQVAHIRIQLQRPFFHNKHFMPSMYHVLRELALHLEIL